ncbi:MAG: peptide chain release factor N(5)-glutamine methyltransferase [Pseudomonadota bacterium]
MHLDRLLRRAIRRLTGSPTPRLDAEVLLCHALGCTRTWLYTWGDREATTLVRARFEALVAARAAGRPVAYLTGEREFWGLSLETHPSTLIPRPDTETLVDVALALAPAAVGRLLDLGTGTGAIALAFASERPDWSVVGIDHQTEAVALARRNAERLAIGNAAFLVSDWFTALVGERFDVIVANPPYVAADDPHLVHGDVRFEPVSALVAGSDGLDDLRYIVAAARDHLVAGGWLALEHGHAQGAAVREQLLVAGYAEVASHHDLAGHERVSLGRMPGLR